VLEHLLDDVSFDAPQRQGQLVSIDAAQVEERLGALSRNEDLSRFVL
jgi:ATP-dependent HslUV protease ATP-binding subunit HslU